MNNLNQNKTDNFFRQALKSGPAHSPSEDDWNKMERLLGNNSKPKAITSRLYWYAGIAASLLIFISIWFSTQPVNQMAQNQQKNQESTESVKTKSKERDVIEQTFTATKTDSKQNVAVKLNKNSHLVESSILAENKTAPKPLELSNPPINETLPELNYAIGESLKMDQTLNQPVAIQKISIITEKPSGNDSLKGPQQKIPSKLTLSMAFTGDMNSVNGLGNSRTGLSYGMGISYRILKNISVGTGIYYSQKSYTSDRHSYYTTEKPFATWASYSKQINAECEVLDIPLNLNLSLLKTEKTGIIAGAGLSSYIMLSEKYNFIYNSSPAYPSSGREYTINNQNKHLLSVINLSLGVVKPFGKQKSLIIQPYAKLPLSGIGQGQTELKSFGIGFQLNYAVKKNEKLFTRKSD